MGLTRRMFGIAAGTALTALMRVPALAQDRPKIRVGVLRLASSGNVFIAADPGHFRDARLDAQLKFFAPLQSMSNVASALKGGRVEAAILPATAAQPLIDSGDARLLGWGGDEAPWQLGAVFVSQKMKANPDLIERFLTAYRRGCKDYHDILLPSVKNGGAALTPETQPLLEAIAHQTNQPVDKIRVGLAFIDPNGALDVQSVAHQLTWFQGHGFVDKGFGLDKVVDPRFVKLP